MELGAVFPQTEIGTDPAAIRDWAQAVEGMGYTHILIYDHVLGASTANRPDWNGPYTSESLFHEIFVLLGYLAAVTQRVDLVTNIVILPQRQTALVAKQAAEVDVLSGGRFRLGVGAGWNLVEYEALGEDFHTRGARLNEQVEVLRALWTEPVITFRGKWHTITEAGLNPLPVQRPIPIWFGAGGPIGPAPDVVLDRIGRLGDGWFPTRAPDDKAAAMIERVHAAARAAGRDPAAIQMGARIAIGQTPEDQWFAQAEGWRSLGATHFGIITMRAGLTSAQAHIDALRQVHDRIGG